MNDSNGANNDAQDQDQRRISRILIGIILLTLPCYCLGITLWQFAPPAAPNGQDGIVVDGGANLTPAQTIIVITSVPEINPDLPTAIPTVEQAPPTPTLIITQITNNEPVDLLPTPTLANPTPGQFVPPTIAPPPTATSTETQTPTPTPTGIFTGTEPITVTPTIDLSVTPTLIPTETSIPTETPTASETSAAIPLPPTSTPAPTVTETLTPTETPVEVATEVPTEVPTEPPAEPPTQIPTEPPPDPPTEMPTEVPTEPAPEPPTEVPTEPPPADTPVPTEPPTEDGGGADE